MAPLTPMNSVSKRMSIQSLLNNDLDPRNPLFRLHMLADTALEMGKLTEKVEHVTAEVFDAANILICMSRSALAPAQTPEQVSVDMASHKAGGEQNAALEAATEAFANAFANAFDKDAAKDEDEPALNSKEARAARYNRRARGEFQAPPRPAKKAKVVKSFKVTKKGPAAPISPRSASTASASPDSTPAPGLSIVSTARRVLSRVEMEEEEYERANATEENGEMQ